MAAIRIDWNPTPKVLRTFGCIGLVGFALLALLANYQKLVFAPLPDTAAKPVACILIALAVYCGLFALIAPRALKPVFLGMSLIGYPIGLAVSFTAMAAIFYLIVTPIALVFKLIGRDAMNRKLLPTAETYWVRRQSPTDIKRYFRQF